MAAAGAAAMLPVVGLVLAVGDLPGYLQAMSGKAAQYAGLGTWEGSLVLLTSLLLQPGVLVLLGLFLIAALGGRYRWLAVAGFAAGVIVLAVPRRCFSHYIVSLFPLIALLIGTGLESSNGRARPVGWISIPLVLLLLLPSASYRLCAALQQGVTRSFEPLVCEIDRLAAADATLMVIGEMQPPCETITYLSRLRPAHRFWIMWELSPPLCEMLSESIDQIRADYAAAPPGVVVVASSYLERNPKGGWTFLDHAQEEWPKNRHNAGLIIQDLFGDPGPYELRTPEPLGGFWIFTRR
jgi:hypothetical protein